MTRFSRQDVLRILQLQAGKLVAWERAGLFSPPADEVYSFQHLSQLRALREVHANSVSARRIRASFDAMQRVSGMPYPLAQASAVRRGSRVAFRFAGSLLDPMTQQLAFDFDTGARPQLRMVQPDEAAADRQHAEKQAQVQEMFLRAVRLEEDPATVAAAQRVYEEILKVRPNHAPAAINLGTIHYHQREFARAEQLYRGATVADPDYALAFFDLGNVLDEMQRLPEAIEAYRRAIALVPGYADAHYNLALAYERQCERRRALRHWTAYVRLDPVGPWAAHAKLQARKILSQERLSIVARRGRLTSAAV